MSNGEDRTFLGIDYGERRIGIAKSDPTGMIASALTTLEVRSNKQALAALAELIEAYEPSGIVIGWPLMPSGDEGDKCAAVDRFVAKLREIYNGPIHKVDERYTSSDAAEVVHAHGQRIGRDKKRLDRLAAVVILQRFLDEGS